ncbi:MAG: hypothetical protein KAT35_03875 [Candidatus Aenigmarchaeota archaeon]|nr:hypothetical protein [Candidatus Aenigmarchaeota archaeon]
MGKVILSVVALIFLLILAGSILPDVVDEAIADTYSEPYEVITGVGETSTTETLSYAHYYTDLTGLSVSSDNSNDSPVVLDYDDATYDVSVSGLEASASRILTINYYREGNQQFTGFNEFVKLSPFLFIIGGIVACLWGLYSGWKNR